MGKVFRLTVARYGILDAGCVLITSRLPPAGDRLFHIDVPSQSLQGMSASDVAVVNKIRG